MVHFAYFGYWVSSIEIYLFFLHFHETMETLKYDLTLFIIPISIIISLLILTFWVLKKSDKKRVRDKRFSSILILFLFIGPIQNIIIQKHMNLKIKKSDFIIKTSWKSFSDFTVFIAPCKFFGNCFTSEEKVKIAYKQKEVDNLNIIIIFGESLRKHNLSLYGYGKKTTPFLDFMKNQKNFYYKDAISSAVFTAVSMPCFLNCLDRPSQVETIRVQNTNLFKLAKNNGFKTHFVSAQSHDSIGAMTSDIALNYIDNFQEAYYFTNNLYKEKDDIFLVEELKKIDLNRGNNFIFLHQNGSHSPYETKYTKEFDKFGDKTKVQKYDNSVLYSDYIFKQIIDYAKTSKKQTIVIYTSDHGEGLGENGIWGHGDLYQHFQREVPFFIYTTKEPLDDKIAKKLKEAKFITHNNISKMVADFLGFSIDKEEIFKKKKIYVIGKDINGLAGYEILNYEDITKEMENKI